jgi:hypothetical protein
VIDRLRHARHLSDAGLQRLAALIRSTRPLARIPSPRPLQARGRRSRSGKTTVSRLVWLSMLGGGLAFAGVMTTVSLRTRSAPVVVQHRSPRSYPPATPQPVVVPLLPIVTPPLPEPAATTPSPAAVRHRPAPRAHSEPAAISPALVEPAPSPRLVSSALTRLRRDQDAEGASALVAEYLRQSPDGPLAEEAWAIGLEAAVSRSDPSAGVMARHYLARFPRGAFVAFARAVAARGAP